MEEDAILVTDGKLNFSSRLVSVTAMPPIAVIRSVENEIDTVMVDLCESSAHSLSLTVSPNTMLNFNQITRFDFNTIHVSDDDVGGFSVTVK